MTYAVQQNLIDRFGEQELVQLTDRDGAGVIDAAVLTQGLADADGIINGYLASRYTVPLATVPAVIVSMASDIARYYLYDDAATEQVTKRYDDAIRFLSQVAKGELSLGVDDAGDAPASGDLPQFEGGGNVFDRDDDSFI
jgi:phage gp36-like protein